MEIIDTIHLNGPHLKTCEYCDIKFYGRNNQKFCCTTHKATFNNLKRTKASKKFEAWFLEMKVSYFALLKSKNDLDKNNWIYIGKLTKFGFNPDCALKKGTNKEGEEFFQLFDIVFRLSDDKNYVQHFKI